MKKLILILSLVFICSITAFAQNGEKEQYIYCELLGTSKLMSSKVSVQIDFGQAQNFWKSKDSRLRDKDGKVINFNSMVDALNYMGNIGWEFVQAYVITNGNQNVYHWLLKKPLSNADIEEMKEMISKEK